MTPTDMEVLTKFAAFIYASAVAHQQIMPKTNEEAAELASLAALLICNGEQKFEPLVNDKQAYKMINTLGLTLEQPGLVVDAHGKIVWSESLSSHLWNNEKASRYAMVKAVASLNLHDPKLEIEHSLTLQQLLYERKPSHNLST